MPPAAPRARSSGLRRAARHLIHSVGAALVAAACTDADRLAPAPPELRIGILPSDTASTVARPVLDGARLAVDEANEAGGLLLGGRRVRVVLIPEPTGGTEQGAVSAAQTLINQRRVTALVGPGVSAQAIGVAGLAEASRIPMVTPSATHPAVTRGRRFAFRVSLMDSAQGVVLARFAARELSARRIAILFDVADPYNRGLAETVRDAFLRLGGSVVAYETYTTDAAGDYAAQLARVRDAGAEVLVLPNYTVDAREQMRQARAAGFAGAFLGSDAWEHTSGIEREPAAEGAFFPRKWLPAAPAGADFDRRFRARFGRPASMTSSTTYDAVGVILAAARAAGSVDPERIRDGMAGLDAYPAVTGSLGYAGSGDPVKAFVIGRIRGGATELHWTLEPQALARLMAGDSLPQPSPAP